MHAPSLVSMSRQAADAPPAVAVRGVSVRYGSRLALADATAEVEPGRLVCLVGLNGAGKSTLLKAILGTVPAAGEVSVLGVRDGRRRSLLAYVPQREDVSWSFPITVQEVVLMAARARCAGSGRRPPPTARRRWRRWTGSVSPTPAGARSAS